MKRAITQAEAAHIYVLAMQRFGPDSPFWPIFNAGIAALWPSKSGLERVKKMAWDMVWK